MEHVACGEGHTAHPSDVTSPGAPVSGGSECVFSDAEGRIRLYRGNSLAFMDEIAGEHLEGRFDTIFADPPYFLSNGGITCHAGKMVRVDKGAWDRSRGPELNHEFNRARLSR